MAGWFEKCECGEYVNVEHECIYNDEKLMIQHLQDRVDTLIDIRVREMCLEILFWQNKYNESCVKLEDKGESPMVKVIIKPVEDLIQYYLKEGEEG